MKLLSGFSQVVAELAIGELDQFELALGRGQTLEVCRPELGHGVVRVDARRGDRPIEPGHDARDIALRGRQGQVAGVSARRAEPAASGSAVSGFCVGNDVLRTNVLDAGAPELNVTAVKIASPTPPLVSFPPRSCQPRGRPKCVRR